MRRFLLPLSVAALAACGGGGSTKVVYLNGTVPGLAELRADSNRDGNVTFDDADANKTDWNDKVGAVFLANIDDDTERCTFNEDDNEVALCNDAQDDVVNGADDLLDLAVLKTKPVDVEAVATGSITVENGADFVRIFVKSGPNPTDYTALAAGRVFTAAEIKAGLELAIEGKDIVRDPATWDGFADVRFTITTTSGPGTDLVHMRVAPVLTYHHLLPENEVWYSDTKRPGNTAMVTDLAKACTAAGISAPQPIEDNDPWAQDFFETAFMSMPGPGGAQHAIHVNYRSANVYTPTDSKNPLRPAGLVVFKLRGKDSAGVQQFNIKHDAKMDSLNSFGNLETVPPHSANGQTYPFGRVLRGQIATFYPDKTFETMIESQAQQPPIYIDTSWLLVGHVDETTSFVKAPTPRGWKLMVNDARLAKSMLDDQVTAGHGDVTMFVGKEWVDMDTEATSPAEISIANVLADTVVMQASAEAAVEVDGQLDILKKELALTDDEIIKIPFLHTTIEGFSAAYSPGTVNGIYLSDTHFASPDPHGPVIDGKDIFKTAVEQPLEAIGITTDWVEDWDEYHVGVGEVHCGTNSTRQIPDAKWWESGR